MFLKQRNQATMPRRVKVFSREHRTSCIKCRIVHAIHRAVEVLLLDENVGFPECGMCACDPVLGKSVRRVHKGMLSRATFLMNGVSLQTGSLRIPGVTTRGEM